MRSIFSEPVRRDSPELGDQPDRVADSRRPVHLAPEERLEVGQQDRQEG